MEGDFEMSILVLFLCIPSFIWTFLYSQKYKISSKYIKWQIIKLVVLFFIWFIFGMVYMGMPIRGGLDFGIPFGILHVVFTIIGTLSGSLIYKMKLYLR